MTMDMTHTITAKSDELTADDLMCGERTIKITKVSINSTDRPVVVNYENDNGKPYKPAKSMRRVMVAAWGADGANYIGQSLIVYRDPSVKWAGIEVGGIRISHMTGLNKNIAVPLTISKGNKKIFHVEPLKLQAQKSLDEILAEVEACDTEASLNALYARYKRHTDVKKIITGCTERKKEILAPTQQEPEYVKPEYNHETGDIIPSE